MSFCVGGCQRVEFCGLSGMSVRETDRYAGMAGLVSTYRVLAEIQGVGTYVCQQWII